MLLLVVDFNGIVNEATYSFTLEDNIHSELNLGYQNVGKNQLYFFQREKARAIFFYIPERHLKNGVTNHGV